MPKKKINSPNSATKEDIRTLRNEINKDIQELKGDFQGLKGDFQGLKSDFQRLRSEINTNFDRVFSELEKIREDRIFALAKDRELEQRVDNLDKRVKVLEGSRV